MDGERTARKTSSGVRRPHSICGLVIQLLNRPVCELVVRRSAETG